MVIFDSMWHSTEMMARENLRLLHRRGYLRQADRRQGLPYFRYHDRSVRRSLRCRWLAYPQFQHAAHRRQLPYLHARPVAQESTSASVWHLAPMVGLRLAPSRCTRSLRRPSSICPCRLSPSSGSPARRTLPSCRPLSRRPSRTPAPSVSIAPDFDGRRIFIQKLRRYASVRVRTGAFFMPLLRYPFRCCALPVRLDRALKGGLSVASKSQIWPFVA